MATSLYHPDTVVRSLIHDGPGGARAQGPEGNWDLRPHREPDHHRHRRHARDLARCPWRPDVPVRHSRMVYAVNRSTARCLTSSPIAPHRRLGLRVLPGWHEKNDRKPRATSSRVGRARRPGTTSSFRARTCSSATPLYKSPEQDDAAQPGLVGDGLRDAAPDAIPVTAYKPAGDRYATTAPTPTGATGRPEPARDYYRVAWRHMAANTGERTLIPAIIPAGRCAHPRRVLRSAAPTSPRSDARFVAAFLARSSATSCPDGAQSRHLSGRTFNRLPFVRPLSRARACAPGAPPELRHRRLRATCGPSAWTPLYVKDAWRGRATPFSRRLGDVAASWTARDPTACRSRTGARRRSRSTRSSP